MLCDWSDGKRLEVVAHEQTTAVLARLGRDIGTVLAGIHSVTFAEGGFLQLQDHSRDRMDSWKLAGEQHLLSRGTRECVVGG